MDQPSVHDITAYDAMMAEVDRDRQDLLVGKGHDSDHLREDVKRRGGRPQIPTKPDGGDLVPATGCRLLGSVSPRNQL